MRHAAMRRKDMAAYVRKMQAALNSYGHPPNPRQEDTNNMATCSLLGWLVPCILAPC